MKSLNRRNITYFIWASLAKYKNCAISLSRLARLYPDTNWTTEVVCGNLETLERATKELKNTLTAAGWNMDKDCLVFHQNYKKINLVFNISTTHHNSFILTITPYVYTVKNTNL